MTDRVPNRRRGLARPIVVALAGALLLSGCEFTGIASLPLPGGVSTGPNAYTVTAKFADVTNLVPQSAVKVNNVTVGRVTDIQLEGWHARVTCELKGSVQLPDNAVATVAQESLLGAKFVRLVPPATAKSRGELSGGDVIPLSSTGRYPEVEEVLSALSLLLNGGGLKQLKTITTELNAVMDGREQRIRDLLDQLDTFVGGLEEQKSEIVRALEGIERLSGQLREQKQVLADAVDRIEPALEVLNEQQDELTEMLVALSDLGDVATEVINASREDLLANLRALEPVLTKLADAGEDLPKALELLLTFPFPGTTKGGLEGDYVNLSVTADLNLNRIVHNLLGGIPYVKEAPEGARPDGRGTGPGESSPGSNRNRHSDKSGQDQGAPEPPSSSLPGSPGGSRGGTDRDHEGGQGGGTGRGDGPSGAPEPEDSDLLDLLMGGGS